MNDSELRQWLEGVSSALVRALNLPPRLERSLSQAMDVMPVASLLRWAEMLGLAKAGDVLSLAQQFPDLADNLATPEAQEAAQQWEKTHQVIPVIGALHRAVKKIVTFWKRGGQQAQHAPTQALAALGISHLVTEGEGFRTQLASAIGASRSNAVALIGSYAEVVVTNETEKLEQADRLVVENHTFGRRARAFVLFFKVRLKHRRPARKTDNDPDYPLWSLSLILREVARGKSETGKGEQG